VPCIIISPWTTGGWVCSQPFDHTSVLQLLEHFTGVREPNISDWRRTTFGDLTSALRIRRADNKVPSLPDVRGQLIQAKYEVANLPKPVLPDGDQSPPKQEPGPRKRV
jgi:phospholipase C